METTWLHDEDSAWRQTLARLRHDVYHLPAYVRVSARHEGGTSRAFLADERDQQLLVPLLIKPLDGLDSDEEPWFDAASPYGYPGPLLAVPDDPRAEVFLRRAVAALVRTLREQRVVSLFVRTHPLLPAPLEPLAEAGRLVHHGDTVSIDLTLPQHALWQQTRASSRNEISQARRAGLTVDHDPHWTAIDAFLDLYYQTMSRVAAHPSYFFEKAYFSALREALDQALHLFVVRHKDNVVGAGLFSEIDGIVEYLFSGSRTDGPALHSTKLMLDHVRTWARDRGNYVLHLGGGVGGKEDSLFHFKAGFSPRRHPFHTWRVVVNPERYEALCARLPATGDAVSRATDFFPLYRAPKN